MNEIEYIAVWAARMLAKMNRDTRAKTEELARRLKLNPEYVAHIEYVADPHNLAAPQVRVFMRSFTLALEREFDIDDDRHMLPDVAKDIVQCARRTQRTCYCTKYLSHEGWYRCAACAVTTEDD